MYQNCVLLWDLYTVSSGAFRTGDQNWWLRLWNYLERRKCIERERKRKGRKRWKNVVRFLIFFWKTRVQTRGRGTFDGRRRKRPLERQSCNASCETIQTWASRHSADCVESKPSNTEAQSVRAIQDTDKQRKKKKRRKNRFCYVCLLFTLMPWKRAKALSGLSARNVRIVLNAWILPPPKSEAT